MLLLYCCFCFYYFPVCSCHHYIAIIVFEMSIMADDDDIIISSAQPKPQFCSKYKKPLNQRRGRECLWLHIPFQIVSDNLSTKTFNLSLVNGFQIFRFSIWAKVKRIVCTNSKTFCIRCIFSLKNWNLVKCLL